MIHALPRVGKDIPPHARASIQLAGEHWTRWLEICDAITSDDDDQTVEDFGAFYAQFRLLQRLGVPFDQAFIQRVEAIAHLCRFGDDDPDADPHDESLTDRDGDNEDEPDFASKRAFEDRITYFKRLRIDFPLARESVMHRITLGLMNSTTRRFAKPEPTESRWARHGQRFAPSRGAKAMEPWPTAGTNLIAIARPAVSS